MASKRVKIKKEESTEEDKDSLNKEKPKSNKNPKYNPNSTEQVKLLLHLLLRAKSKKLDSLGICWEDEDLGKGGYADWFDLPSTSLSVMLEEITRIVKLS